MTPLELWIWIPGQPKGKERARSRVITTKSGRSFSSHYTPKQTRENEASMRSYAIGAMQSRPPTDQPVHLELVLTYQIPKSWPAWKQHLAAEGKIVPTVKPDIDNVEKSVKDAFNTVVWHDDQQVVSCTKRKRFGLNPGIDAKITDVDAYPAQVRTRQDVAA